MFPDEHHIKIVRRIDAMEAEVYAIYRKIERLRLDLQREWRVLPSGGRWSERSHQASELSAAVPQSADAVDPVDGKGTEGPRA